VINEEEWCKRRQSAEMMDNLDGMKNVMRELVERLEDKVAKEDEARRVRICKKFPWM
jgi:hypothetical protein